MTIEVEYHQLDLKYEELRSTSATKEQRLLASLLSTGQQSPVVVVGTEKSNHYVLIDGYKRVRLLRRLVQDTVIATVWQLDELEALIMERLLRKSSDDNALEQGRLLQELQNRFGLTIDQLSIRFSVSKSWICRRLGLVRSLPIFIQQAVHAGRIVPYAAMKYLLPLARANSEAAERLCNAIIDSHLSSREIGVLYVGYQQAENEEARELIINKPEIYLRAKHEISSKKHSDPWKQLLSDAKAVFNIGRRLRRNILEIAIDQIAINERQQLKDCLHQVYRDTKEIFEYLRNHA